VLALKEEKREKRGGFDQLLYLEETAVRPLTMAAEENGVLPLLVGDEVLSRDGGRDETPGMQLQVGASPEQEITIRLPLVPPVASYRPLNPVRLAASGLQLEARYRGAVLEVVLRRPQPKRRPKQLRLPDVGE
jgi:hypothetical protein